MSDQRIEPRRGSTSIILIRHAHPVIPVTGGPDDYRRPLVAEGMRQAHELAAELSRLRPALIVSSPYLRAVQTVQPLSRALELPVHTMHELREWDSGLPPTPEWERHYAHSWADPAFARESGESLEQLTTRATGAVAALARQHPASTVVAASHGTFIARALVGFGVPEVGWPFSRAMPMPAVYRLDFLGDRLYVDGPGLAAGVQVNSWDYP